MHNLPKKKTVKRRLTIALVALVSLSRFPVSQCMWCSIPGIEEQCSDIVDLGNSLLNAALADDINHVRWRLESGTDPNMGVTTIKSCPETISIGRDVLTPRDLLGSTALHCAVHHTKVTRLLLAHGTDPNIKNYRGCTPLHDASSSHYFYTMEALIEHGADLDARDHRNETPLQKAAAFYILSNIANSYLCRLQTIAVRTLLEAGAAMEEDDAAQWPARTGQARKQENDRKRTAQLGDRTVKRART